MSRPGTADNTRTRGWLATDDAGWHDTEISPIPSLAGSALGLVVAPAFWSIEYARGQDDRLIARALDDDAA